MHRSCNVAVACTVLTILAMGCLPALPDNVAVVQPERSMLYEANGAVFSQETGMEDATWIDIPRADGTGTVGGYLSNHETTNGGLVILLRGASTLNPAGGINETRLFFESFGLAYRQAGYRTFSLEYPECGNAYGQGEVDDLITLIDWLDGGGKAILGVDHIYTIGFSVGATAAMVANRQRQVAAVVAIAGITEPLQIQQWWGIYALAASIYPNNEGMCQVGATLNTYGLPWSSGWDALNTVAHVNELKSPMLVVQGTEDQLFSIANTVSLDAAYQRALTLKSQLPPLEFLYQKGQNHFAPVRDPAVTSVILAFFERFHGVATFN